MSKKVRWGVVGSGGIALRRTIPEGIVPASNAVLTAVSNRNGAVNSEVARRFGAQAAGSLEDLLKTDVEAVYIATPVHRHFEEVLACIQAGKHVLCEKPLALNVPQAEQMANAAASAGLLLGVGFMLCFQSQHLEAHRMIQEGRIGRPVYARAQLSCWYPPLQGAWRQDPDAGGGGALMDMGAHLIHLLEMFFGRISQVNCFTGNLVHPYRAEDSAVALLSFENGAMGTIDTFFCVPDASSRSALELYGSSASILARNTIGQGASGEMRFFAGDVREAYDAQQGRAGTEGEPVAPQPVNPYLAEIEDFSAAILESRRPAVDAEAGLRNQRVLAACYESARLGRAICIERGSEPLS
jgi:predicted dehydrogenase